MFPGKSFRGELPKLTEAQAALRDALKKDVQTLAGDIGPRHVGRYNSYLKAAGFLEKSLKDAGYQVQRQTFTTRGRECYNLVIELPGDKLKDEIVVIGAHYDSAGDTPAANDNGSGVAAVLALARMLKGATPDRTLRLVLFANEEQPFFQSEAMGSYVYARACQRRKEPIVAMLSLETLGYYSDAKGSQKYPAPLSLMYPSTGNFVGFVGNLSSRKLVGQAIGSFRRHARFPSEAAALPGNMEGVGWSDHWSFWQCGYPAAMVTDTAFFRYPHYHLASDTPDKLDYERLARVVDGLGHVVRDLASAAPGGERENAEKMD